MMHRRRFLRVGGGLAAGAVAGLLSGCNDSETGAAPAPSTSSTPRPSASATTDETTEPPEGSVSATVEGTVATGLAVPWGIAFLPSDSNPGTALVSERDTARILRVTPGRDAVEVGVVPGVRPGIEESGEGGLLGLLWVPESVDRPLYAYLSTAEDNRVVRMSYERGRIGEPEVVLAGIPTGVNHNGGRLALGPDGMVYISTGEIYEIELAQDKDSLGGKILRMTPDGRLPFGNPFKTLVWSYGHRNVEGLSFDGAGRLWSSEFGAQTWDELNLIEGGSNYGWPLAEGSDGENGFTRPVSQWPTEDCSPGSVAVTQQTAWVPALQGECLWAVPLTGEVAGRQVRWLDGEYGRLRTAQIAPDGALWVSTSNKDGRGSPTSGDDRILRVVLSA
jgi:glucose/arabinose dehydrogenase